MSFFYTFLIDILVKLVVTVPVLFELELRIITRRTYLVPCLNLVALVALISIPEIVALYFIQEVVNSLLALNEYI